MKTLADLQNTAFLAIGPSRIAALSLLSLARAEDASKGKDVFKMSVKRLDVARDMLRKDLPDLLKEQEHSFPGDLEAQRDACLAALEPAFSMARDLEAGRNPSLSQIENFDDHCLYVLEPTVSTFVADMTKNLLETHAQRMKARDAEMIQAINNAESVGRNIQLIAFNASVEAARIGEMGRGFAVIATEIRQLSGKTQTLLDDISDLLRSA
ncbi:Methyl-accepting chemotaxis protein 4 [Tritonibacter multivorans]|uniref:Methyl-accepting chemotaxis protein 4 n=1 Tax=Tritonibacter multivorans TaxID=928856 RepID=A0A0N7M0I0_9RHOB|nr:methyl-accepting chemotaxis protein [Tritonibacter multivorans]MDA7420922.1 methyl-accepting chemotaxis protein [Tritonibacter multivorans]CUH80521.1 Methyl-accepting chemotaxis protein 4 [Tritonibacter multivorans]SFC81855.1 methyl-accepting chemotaxis protein [Tritonibacter multivorans]